MLNKKAWADPCCSEMPDDRVPQLGEHSSRRLHGLCHACHAGRGDFQTPTLDTRDQCFLTKVYNFLVWHKISKGL
jgi:hypothetical protein